MKERGGKKRGGKQRGGNERRGKERGGKERGGKERGGKYFEPPDYLASCLLQIVYSTKHISRDISLHAKYSPLSKASNKCIALYINNTNIYKHGMFHFTPSLTNVLQNQCR